MCAHQWVRPHIHALIQAPATLRRPGQWGGEGGEADSANGRRTSITAHRLASIEGEEAPEKLSFLSTLKLALELQTLLVARPKRKGRDPNKAILGTRTFGLEAGKGLAL